MTTYQVIATALMIVMAFIGFLCAARLTSQYPVWLRLVLLSPSIGALALIHMLASGRYVACSDDVALGIVVCLVYALVFVVLTYRSSDFAPTVISHQQIRGER